MPTVAELSDPYGNFMLGPRHGRNVCSECFNLTEGYGRCYACTYGAHRLDAMVPISYSVASGQLHHALASYKRLWGAGTRQLSLELAAVLWRHLAGHERCLARAAGLEAFHLVTTVPSSDRRRADTHPLHLMVRDLVGAVRGRYEPLLSRTDAPAEPHRFSAQRYVSRRQPGGPAHLEGRSVLLIDDTWTTGANAQSAAAALKEAGSGPVAVIVIGRFLNRDWRHNDHRLRGLDRPFDWGRCALCQPRPAEPVKD